MKGVSFIPTFINNQQLFSIVIVCVYEFAATPGGILSPKYIVFDPEAGTVKRVSTAVVLNLLADEYGTPLVDA